MLANEGKYVYNKFETRVKTQYSNTLSLESGKFAFIAGYRRVTLCAAQLEKIGET